MRPFSLEQALSGNPIITRDGRPARILASDVNNPNCRMVVAVTNSTGIEDVHSYTLEGEWMPNHPSKADLFMKDNSENTTSPSKI